MLLAFQNIDIRESISTSNTSEIHLFGATKVGLVVPLVQKYHSYIHQSGHSILVRVLDFEHYFYYPAPRGLSADDMGPMRDYLNVGRVLLPIFCLAQTNFDPSRMYCNKEAQSFPPLNWKIKALRQTEHPFHL